MFPFFNHYPGTDLHEIDLAYILKLCAELRASNTTLTQWKAAHEAEYTVLANKVDGLINSLVDVIVPWDSSIAYQIYSIVEYQGTNYIALQDVPVGVMITNTDYWQPANTALEQLNAISVSVSEMRDAIALTHNVTYYGADTTGAEYSDDAIAAAIEANKGGIIYFPQGTYKISRPIKTYNHFLEACSIFMDADAKLLTDTAIECIFDIGALDSSTGHYPTNATQYYIYGGVLECDNTQYGVIFENNVASYIMENVNLYHCTNGIKIARTSGDSQDVWVRKCYLMGYGSQAAGNGIEILGSDNAVVDTKINGFQKGIINSGGYTYLLNDHILGQYRNNADIPTVFPDTLAVDIHAECIMDGVYCDGYYMFADIYAPAIIKNCVFHNYSQLSGLDVFVFRINTHVFNITITDNKIDMLAAATSNIGIGFASTFNQSYLRLLNGLTINNNRIQGAQYIKPGDLIFGNTKNSIVPKVNVSNARTFAADTWYSLGYIACSYIKTQIVYVVLEDTIFRIMFKAATSSPYATILSVQNMTGNTKEITFGIQFIEAVGTLPYYRIGFKTSSSFHVNIGVYGDIMGYLSKDEFDGTPTNFTPEISEPAVTMAST